MYMNTLYSITKYRIALSLKMFLTTASGVGGSREGLRSWLSNTGPDTGQGSFFNQNHPLNSKAVIRDPEACHG